jgi:hypothetical protein
LFCYEPIHEIGYVLQGSERHTVFGHLDAERVFDLERDHENRKRVDAELFERTPRGKILGFQIGLGGNQLLHCG